MPRRARGHDPMSGKRLMVLIVTVAVLGAWLSSRTPSAPALASLGAGRPTPPFRLPVASAVARAHRLCRGPGGNATLRLESATAAAGQLTESRAARTRGLPYRGRGYVSPLVLALAGGMREARACVARHQPSPAGSLPLAGAPPIAPMSRAQMKTCNDPPTTTGPLWTESGATTACASMAGWCRSMPRTAGAGAVRSPAKTGAAAPANWSTCARSLANDVARVAPRSEPPTAT